MATPIGKRAVVVVLEGAKAARHEKGIAPLRWAWRNVVKKDDELLVLNVLNPTVGTSMGICCLGDFSASSSEGENHLRFLYQQIEERREIYLRIFRPFHNDCKGSGVKFEVKVAAGFKPNTIVMEAASCVKASWIVMDRCLASDECLRLHKETCNVAVVNDDEEAEVHNVSSIRTNIPRSHDDRPISVLGNRSNSNHPHQEADEKSSSMQLRDFEMTGGLNRLPVELSWEEVLRVSGGLQARPCILGEHFEVYGVRVAGQPESSVMVKRFAGRTNGVIEAEKRVAMFMSHKNILRATAYHETAAGSALVYHRYHGEGSLEKYLNHERGRPAGLTWLERMKVAIEISRGMRYMHELCPGGPVVHRDLKTCNVFLQGDCQPLISGFGSTRWLKMEQMAMEESRYRCWHEVPSDDETVALVKSDVFDFGVLLLRLFCQRPLPQDDSQLVHWARPLLIQGAFHELIGQDVQDLDMYEMYRVMNVATQCTKTKPISRPSMTQVLSILRGEHLCCLHSSPSSETSFAKNNHLT